jgi:hypothetical protein
MLWALFCCCHLPPFSCSCSLPLLLLFAAASPQAKWAEDQRAVAAAKEGSKREPREVAQKVHAARQQEVEDLNSHIFERLRVAAERRWVGWPPLLPYVHVYLGNMGVSCVLEAHMPQLCLITTLCLLLAVAACPRVTSQLVKGAC